MIETFERRALSVSEFIRAFGFSRGRVYQEVNAGRLKMYKLGRKSFFLKEDIDAWLASLPQSTRGAA
jgi:excisionase family DNA binding protein